MQMSPGSLANLLWFRLMGNKWLGILLMPSVLQLVNNLLFVLLLHTATGHYLTLSQLPGIIYTLLSRNGSLLFGCGLQNNTQISAPQVFTWFTVEYLQTLANCWKANEHANHLCKCPSLSCTALLEDLVAELQRWMSIDNHTDKFMYWVPNYIRGRGQIHFVDLGKLSPCMHAIEESQDLIGWHNFMKGCKLQESHLLSGSVWIWWLIGWLGLLQRSFTSHMDNGFFGILHCTIRSQGTLLSNRKLMFFIESTLSVKHNLMNFPRKASLCSKLTPLVWLGVIRRARSIGFILWKLCAWQLDMGLILIMGWCSDILQCILGGWTFVECPSDPSMDACQESNKHWEPD